MLSLSKHEDQRNSSAGLRAARTAGFISGKMPGQAFPPTSRSVLLGETD
jgi:hypothetical protein